MSDLKQRIYDVAKDFQLLNVATITEDGKPRVRYVVGKADADLAIRFCTSLDSNKVRQIRENPTVHITLGAKDAMTAVTWLQVDGIAEISTMKAERDAFWFDGLKNHFSGPDDPNYCIVITKPSSIELGSMKSRMPEVWEPGK
jgi:general stress protein 26